jgi:hypothetical protein
LLDAPYSQLATMKIQRRRLQFDRLAEAVTDAEDLLASGYYKTGNWNLAQCCQHLATVMLYPLDGFPKLPLHLRVATFLMRYTIAPMMLKRILADNRWPERVPTDPSSIPGESGDDAVAVLEYRRAVDRLLTHEGLWKTSPLFGRLEKATLVRLHCIHAAHHLGFLVPK